MLPEGTPKTGKNAVKPRTASLFKSMSLDTVTLEDALKLMSLPRVVGTDAEGEEITAQNGRYGPYLKKGTDSRSLRDRGAALHDHARRGAGDLRPAQAARAGRRQAAAEGAGRRTRSASKPVVVKDGRFGPYVTDGETNATLRPDDSVETITPERGFELLAEKRAKGPAKKTAKKAPRRRRRRRRRPPRRPPAKKTAAEEDGGQEDGRQENDDSKTAAKKAPGQEGDRSAAAKKARGVGGLSAGRPAPG